MSIALALALALFSILLPQGEEVALIDEVAAKPLKKVKGSASRSEITRNPVLTAVTKPLLESTPPSVIANETPASEIQFPADYNKPVSKAEAEELAMMGDYISREPLWQALARAYVRFVDEEKKGLESADQLNRLLDSDFLPEFDPQEWEVAELISRNGAAQIVVRERVYDIEKRRAHIYPTGEYARFATEDVEPIAGASFRTQRFP